MTSECRTYVFTREEDDFEIITITTLRWENHTVSIVGVENGKAIQFTPPYETFNTEGEAQERFLSMITLIEEQGYVEDEEGDCELPDPLTPPPIPEEVPDFRWRPRRPQAPDINLARSQIDAVKKQMMNALKNIDQRAFYESLSSYNSATARAPYQSLAQIEEQLNAMKNKIDDIMKKALDRKISRIMSTSQLILNVKAITEGIMTAITQTNDREAMITLLELTDDECDEVNTIARAYMELEEKKKPVPPGQCLHYFDVVTSRCTKCRMSKETAYRLLEKDLSQPVKPKPIIRNIDYPS